MYKTGRGVPQDDAEAVKWYRMAAGQGVEIAVEFRNMVSKEMIPAQIAEAQRVAREWKPK